MMYVGFAQSAGTIIWCPFINFIIFRGLEFFYFSMYLISNFWCQMGYAICSIASITCVSVRVCVCLSVSVRVSVCVSIASITWFIGGKCISISLTVNNADTKDGDKLCKVLYISKAKCGKFLW